MQIDIITLFPEMFGYLNQSILGKAQEAGLLNVQLRPLRPYGIGKHHITDEPPYGGGGGMVLKPDPIFACVADLHLEPDMPLILLSPQGRSFNQTIAQELSQHPRLVLLCGRYEGVDERVRQHLVTDEISIGDFVLTGGELPAMILVDALARLIPNVLGAEDAAEDDSHATGLLEGPHYTRPASFKGWDVPELLRSGHQVRIGRWRREQALRRTWQRRPEMLLTADLSAEDQQFLAQLALETANVSQPTNKA